MKTGFICAVVLLLAIGSLALQRAAAADAAALKQFTAKFVITEMRDGKEAVLAQPTLLTPEGQEASYLSGGEAAVDAETKETIPFGLKARIKVREVAADKLRVSMYAGQSELDVQGGSNFTIRESGVHCVRTVKPGEKIEVDLGSGRKVTVSVDPVTAKQ